MSKAISTKALEWARSQLAERASNKQSGKPGAEERAKKSAKLQDDMEKRIANWAKLGTELTESLDLLKRLKNSRLLRTLGELRATKAGNCSAYSLLALGYIHACYPRIGATIFSLGGDGDHVFVAVNIDRNDNFGDDMEKWPDYVWICDPWANLVCPAPQYYGAFSDKMGKWNDSGKRILYAGGWTSPTDAKYLACLKSPKKRQDWEGNKPNTLEKLDSAFHSTELATLGIV